MVYGQQNSILSNLSFSAFLATIIKIAGKTSGLFQQVRFLQEVSEGAFMAAIFKNSHPSSHVFQTWLFHIEKNPTNEASLNKINFEISYLSL